MDSPRCGGRLRRDCLRERRLVAVGVAVEDAEVGGPGADIVAELVGEGAGELVEVGEVVRGPGGEQVAEGNFPEGRVDGGACEVGGLQVKGVQRGEVAATEVVEGVEEFGE